MLRSLAVVVAVAAVIAAQPARPPLALDAEGERWVHATLGKLTLDEKIGQMLVSSFESTFISTDSTAFDTLVRAVHEYHVGGFHVFGGSERVPAVLLSSGY